MKLNHLNLCVHDITEASDFFQKIFDFHLLERKGDAVAIVSDRESFTLVLSNTRAFGGESSTYPKDFHIGFYVDTAEEVDRFYDRLAAANIGPDHGPRKIRDGYSLYFNAIDGLLFEVTCLNR
ncbi:VOC family protein [Paenibacillus sepulcri]|uniref:VOC family protein n=1 Tax=Paenibacillus sepulcri TaxID=359917 RepID=A0ABS7C6G4_9BACL|nr:VOC family protein [Paenibacillus sepulcri]